METNPIVAQLDVPRNILKRLLPCRVSCAVDALNFQRRIERFGQAVVEAYPGPADGLADPEPSQDRRELARSVIAAAVRMKDSISRKIEGS
jgi:hypothetical protein